MFITYRDISGTLLGFAVDKVATVEVEVSKPKTRSDKIVFSDGQKDLATIFVAHGAGEKCLKDLLIIIDHPEEASYLHIMGDGSIDRHRLGAEYEGGLVNLTKPLEIK